MVFLLVFQHMNSSSHSRPRHCAPRVRLHLVCQLPRRRPLPRGEARGVLRSAHRARLQRKAGDPLSRAPSRWHPTVGTPAIISAPSPHTGRSTRGVRCRSSRELQSSVRCSRNEHRSGTDPKADLRLREAAAKLHADAVLILATETQATDGRIIAPLTELSLGLLPNKRYELISTALAALVDTRTGYIYGTIEKSRARSGITMAWGGDEVIQRARAKVEREAMEKLFADFPAFWRGVVDTHRR